MDDLLAGIEEDVSNYACRWRRYNMLSRTALLETLEGNRRLTIRSIEAFPEKELFTFTAVESMRPFSEMVLEILAIETGYIRGIGRLICLMSILKSIFWQLVTRLETKHLSCGSKFQTNGLRW